MIRRLLFLCVVAGLGGCAVAVPEGGAGGTPREVWRGAGVSSYAYTLEISCFCLHRGRFAVEVREGSVASVREAEGGAAVRGDQAARVVTVDGLFELIAEAEAAGTPVRAEYHPRLGHPTEAEIGLLANDSGTLYRIEDLRPL